MVTHPGQGPDAGRTLPAEDETVEDPRTGATVRRLTTAPDATDLHPYFTEPCLYDDGRRMVISSDRTGETQFYGVDLASGELRQLTDVPEAPGGTSNRPAVSAEGHLVAGWSGQHLVAVDLDDLSLSVCYERPEGYVGKIPGVSADGSHVLVSIVENVRDRTGDDWMREKFELGPHSKVLAVPTDGSGDVEVLLETDRWIGHVNPSPTDPWRLTYCEEGPWSEVDNRIWVLDAESGESWQVRNTPGDGGVGHEYWQADGERVGYHGYEPTGEDGRRAFAGHARYDDSDRVETEIPPGGTHTHSNSPALLVTDGSTDVPCNLLYRWDEAAGAYEGPRALASHDWGRGSPHPHSRLLPGDDRVVFDATGPDGSAAPFVAEVGDMEALPELSTLETDEF